MQYFKEKNDKQICLLCSYYCQLKLNQTGICGVNKNINNKIKCLVYGHISAFNVDPIEKKPLYHFLPNSKSLSLGTVGCNFKCSFCQNHGISQEKNIDTSNYISPQEIVQIAIQKDCKSISYTYNEPTIFYPFAKDIALEAKKYNIKSVFVSNGFESSEVIDDMKDIIDAVNVDLKSFNSDYYKKKLGGNLQQILDNLIHFKKNNIWLEVTTLIIPTKNDSKEELFNMASFIKKSLGEDTPWHLSAFHPDYKELELPRTSFEKLKQAYDIAKKVGLKNVYIGNVSYENNTYCKNCNELLISRKYFKIIKNIIVDSACPKCSKKVKGVFEMSNKKISIAGTFYPNNKEEILDLIKGFNNSFKLKSQPLKAKAIISPHAGYIYSGFTANLAFNIASQNQNFERVVVIGPSHKVYFEKASICLNRNYETPLGDIEVDTQYANKILEKYQWCDYIQDVHEEHSTKTQAPFIKHYFSNSKIVEIVYGKIDFNDLSKLIENILDDEKTFLVISTDLSHFYNLKEANYKDNICLNAIVKKDLTLFDKGAEACGMIGVKALVKASINKNLENEVLHYCTSFDRTKDDSRVVGYACVLVGNKS
jgi:AmmeMemoRadiSam system radical SAM enzyme/AmmeMemoRadiSam system protein B